MTWCHILPEQRGWVNRISILYILFVCIRVSDFFTFLANTLMSSMFVKWLVLMCFCKFVAACEFPKCVMECHLNYHDSTYIYNISRWIFTLAKLSPLAVNYTLQFFIVFSIKFMNLTYILYILLQSITIQLRDFIICFLLLSIHDIAIFFVSFCSL